MLFLASIVATWLRYETFYYLWVKGNSTWGERRTIFLCWFFHLLPSPPSRAAPSRKLLVWSRRAPKVNRLLPPRQDLNSKSQIPKILSQHFRCMTSFTFTGPNSYLGFLFLHLWMTHPLRVRVNTCVNVVLN